MTVSQAPLHEQTIRYVKGVGPRRAAQLAQLGIDSVEDALYYPPHRYEDRARLAAIAEAQPGDPVTVRGRVLTAALRRGRRGGRAIFEATIGDASGVLHAIWFHQPYLAQQIQPGQEVILYGKREPGSRPQMIHPELERVEGDEDGRGSTGSPLAPSEQSESRGSLHVGRIVPIYPVASGIGQRWFRQMMAGVLEQHADDLEEWLPEPLRASRGWPGAAEAVRQLHFPATWDALGAAKERLVFEELFLLQLAMAQRRARTVVRTKPQRYQLDGPLSRGLRARLPFALTPDQRRVLDELLADLSEAHPMYRLLQGDVGCGKTIVVIGLMAVAVQSGWQAALMAPTELLAEQHARVITRYLGPLGVSVGLLSQSVAPADRRRRLEAVAAGTIQVAVGTHALIQRGVSFKRLALVVVDEQHKFGVIQRAHLAKKGPVPDVLVMTATPIPRTLALSLYGDLAVSTISQLPPGRSPIDTLWIREAQRAELYTLIRNQLRQGRQGYVVYPLVEEQEAKALKAAAQMAKRLQAVFAEFRVGLLHGQMKPAQKDKTMSAFARGELHLLVSTVIVEVGLDVPNATLMVIEHPERFGLAQLHQLRGRIGRGEHPATCVLVSDAEDEAVRQRLGAFVQTTDGFALAEKDLEQRGPGQLLGRRQHGWFRFRIADLSKDRALLESARQEADALIARDPGLDAPDLAALRARLDRFRQRPA